MIATKERAAAISHARRAVKLLTEHAAPTHQDVGAARDRLSECYNLPEPTQVWEAVDRLEDTAAQTYGVPDVDQGHVAELQSPAPTVDRCRGMGQRGAVAARGPDRRVFAVSLCRWPGTVWACRSG